IVAGASATMHVVVPSGGVSQPFNVGVFGNSGNTLAYALANFTFDDFTLSTPSTAVTLKAGQSVDIPIKTDKVQGSSDQQVTFQLTGKPPGVSMTANPPTVTTGGSTVATVR